jgi:short-subunit dehydrogenase
MKNIALITGASGGIGMELAKIHAGKGGDLVLVARRENELNQLRTELIEKFKVEIEIIAIDLMRPHASKEIVNILEEKKIQIDVLMNNAGLGGYGKFHERDLQKELDMIQLNITALTELTHLILPGMVDRKKGKILNTASTAGMLPGPLQSVYYATKAYVISFSQAVAHEVSKQGVTVTALCPGPVKTNFEKAAGMEGSGLFAKAATAESTARKGYVGMEKGKLIVITDRLMSFGLNWLVPLMPRKLVLKFVERLQTVK